MSTESTEVHVTTGIPLKIKLTWDNGSVKKVIEVDLSVSSIKSYDIHQETRYGKIMTRKTLKWFAPRVPDYAMDAVLRNILTIKSLDDLRAILAIVAPYID